MHSIRGRVYGLLALSIVLQVSAFPIAGQMAFWRSFFAWVALVPFLLALLSGQNSGNRLKLRQGILLGYGCGFFFYLLNCSWIYQTMYLYGGLPKPVAFVILVLFAAYLGLYHVLFASLIMMFQRSGLSRGATLGLAPGAWVAVELARACITGFPWDLLGYSQVDNFLLLRLAPFGGVMAISFVLAAVSSLLAYGCMADNAKTRWKAIAGSLALIAVALFVGHARPAFQAPPTQTAVLLQEDLSVGATARSSRPLSPQQELLAFSALSLHPPGSDLRTTPPAIVIWPEAPAHLLANDPAFRSAMGDLARGVNAPLVIGSIGVDENTSAARGYAEFDSAALFDRSGSYQGRYDKIHLVPWGEYVPYKDLFAFARKLTEGVGDMDAGTMRTLFHTDGHAYGIFICYESIFGDEVRQFVRGGAQVLVNISDDGWYGDSGAPWQHLNMARMRAVENHRWLLRDTNTGETTVIDPQGRYTETRRHVRTAYVLPFDFESDLTVYTRFGDWFAYLCSGVTVLALGFSLRRRIALK